MHHGPIFTPVGKYDSAGGSPIVPWKNKAGLGVQIETVEGLVYILGLITSGRDAI